MTTCARSIEKFADLDKCNQVIDDLLSKSNRDDSKQQVDVERSFEEFKRITDIYLQQPELLDGHSQTFIARLTNGLSEIPPSTHRYYGIFKFLYQLIKVSGFKTIGKEFPHEIDKLPLILNLLEGEDINDKYNWETRYVLTVWLSIVILAPFDLAKFDQPNVDKNSDSSIANRIYKLLLRNFTVHDSCQQVTAYCLAKFLSRTDMLKDGHYIKLFMTSAGEELSDLRGDLTGAPNDVKLIAYLRTLAYIFKIVPRLEVRQHAKTMIDVLSVHDMDKLTQHLVVKLLQRVGLSLLPVRQANWRYKRITRYLGGGHQGQHDEANQDQQDDQEDESNASDELEFILSVLLLSGQNAQTKTRWSAAKGLARICSRLSRQRADDVVDAILDKYFDRESNEFAWHGGCLTLAEMSRHGLILEGKLERLVKIVGEAVVYDRIKGSLAVGAHVREAACYICWAMARIYEDQVLKPHVWPISTNLLCVMLFDREVQCRRAASAAFQELIGRQGTFSEQEIGILTELDYHNVGVRQSTYLHLAPRVGSYSFDRFTKPFVGHLLDKKLCHWDLEIRRLAAECLALLMLHCNQDYIQTQVMPFLMDKSSSPSSNDNEKHGALLGLSRLVRSLVPLQYEFDSKLVEQVASAVSSCQKQLKSRQQAPKFIEALCSLLSSAELANFCFGEGPSLEQWQSLVWSALDMDDQQVRQAGAQALLSLYRGFYKSNKGAQDQLLTRLNRNLLSANESTRCGALLSMGLLSEVPAIYAGGESSSTIRVDADTPDILLSAFASYLSRPTREPSTDMVMAHAKAQACESAAHYVMHLGDEHRLVLSLQLVKTNYDCLLDKLEDYTFDKRGDIGVVVRRAATRALRDLTLHLANEHRAYHKCMLGHLFTADRLTKLVERLLGQCVSYNDSARELACSSLYDIMLCEGLPRDNIAHHGFVMALYDEFGVHNGPDSDSFGFDWRNRASDVYVRLLCKPEYAGAIWQSLMTSVGQASELGAKPFKASLTSYLRPLVLASTPDSRAVFGELLATLRLIDSAHRLVMPAMTLLDFLVSESLLPQADQGELNDLCSELADFCWTRRLPAQAASEKAADPKRLMAAGRVLCSLVPMAPGEASRKSQRRCLALLGSGFAKVRSYVAGQLYVAIMSLADQRANDNSDGSDELDLDTPMQLLADTNWSEPLATLAPIRQKLESDLGEAGLLANLN